VSYQTGDHTNELVTLQALGAGASLFTTRAGTWYPGTQIVDNTQIRGVICDAVAAGTRNVLLFIGDGMQLESEIAASRYLYGQDHALAWHTWGEQPNGWSGFASTWDVKTYDKYAGLAGMSAYDPAKATAPGDPQANDPSLGYDVARGGTAPYPLPGSDALAISRAAVTEHLPVGTLVGDLSTTNLDTAGDHTYTLVSGAGSTDNAAFTIVDNHLLTNAVFDSETTPSCSIRVRSTDQAGQPYEKSLVITVTHVVQVQSRKTFYNHSAWDGYDPAANAQDDAAIATDKQALLFGETATFANYTSYSKGLNGLMIDVFGMPGTPLASDFQFRFGNDLDPTGWTTAPDPCTISIRRGAGDAGSDRITLAWPDFDPSNPGNPLAACSNGWLQVTLKATANTGLAAADVFYFGNLAGETGNSPGLAVVDKGDLLQIRQAIPTAAAGLADPYDINRDGVVDTADRFACRLDYASSLVLFTSLPAPAGSSFAASSMFANETVIDPAAAGPSSAIAADLDGDADPDVVVAMVRSLVWYENDGSQGFAPHTIATTATTLTSAVAADLDGDGDLDVVVSSFEDGRIVWYENDGTPADGPWTAHVISAGAAAACSVAAADLDHDGDLDVLSGAWHGNEIAWYENDGNAVFTEHAITTALDLVNSVVAADLDGDGDLDAVSASWNDDTIAWHENDGTPADGGWVTHSIDTTADGAQAVSTADLDGDGDLDVLAASYNDNTIAWYENDGTPLDGGWTKHVINSSALGAWGVSAADMDGDGNLDVLSASDKDGTVAWYANDGTPADGGWTTQIITPQAEGAWSICAVDLNGDQGPDALVGANLQDRVSWYGNQGRYNLDVDGNGAADALTDGILILRYLFDPNGAWNYSDALGSGATRTARPSIRSFLDGGRTALLDVDGNGTPDALTDGILILRYLFDPAGVWNYSDALGSGATRTTRTAIRAFLDLYNPGITSASGAASAVALPAGSEPALSAGEITSDSPVELMLASPPAADAFVALSSPAATMAADSVGDSTAVASMSSDVHAATSQSAAFPNVRIAPTRVGDLDAALLRRRSTTADLRTLDSVLQQWNRPATYADRAARPDSLAPFTDEEDNADQFHDDGDLDWLPASTTLKRARKGPLSPLQ
jgi:hypothetical protein